MEKNQTILWEKGNFFFNGDYVSLNITEFTCIPGIVAEVLGNNF